MDNIQKKIKKQKYHTPKIERIRLDNEISLQLESDPPYGPGESYIRHTPEKYLQQDPFKMT